MCFLPLKILDPPGSDLPPRRGRRYERDEEDGDDVVEKRNAVNWGEEFPEGDSSAFLALGPNARVSTPTSYLTAFLLTFLPASPLT